jgi:hypothetical protein
MKKIVALMIPSFVVGLYTAFVVMCMWNWFAAPALNLSEITYLNMLGLIWLMSLLSGNNQKADDFKWKTLFTTIEFCIPDDKREEALETINGLQENVWIEVVGHISGQIVVNTITLVLGFILHSLVI